MLNRFFQIIFKDGWYVYRGNWETTFQTDQSVLHQEAVAVVTLLFNQFLKKAQKKKIQSFHA